MGRGTFLQEAFDEFFNFNFASCSSETAFHLVIFCLVSIVGDVV